MSPTLRPCNLGDTVNLAVGQGDLQATPIQLAVAYAAIENGGTIVRPHLGLEIETPRRVSSASSRSRARGSRSPNLAAIADGLHPAASAPAARPPTSSQRLPATPVYGKTGTAERGARRDQSWYVAYVPTRRPIVVAATVEEGGFGAEVAAPSRA